jgi:integrase
MEDGEYLAIRAHLPAAYQDVLDFGYLSGWRRGEVLTLEWRDVDRDGRVIHLRSEVSKTREGCLLVPSARLHAVMERRWHARALGCPLVFHEAARSLQGFKNAWERVRLVRAMRRPNPLPAPAAPLSGTTPPKPSGPRSV